MQVIIFISSCPGTVPGSLFTPHATNIVIHNIEPRTTLPVNQSCCRRITRNIHTSQQHFVKIRHCFCPHHILRILRQKIAASAKKKYYDHIYIFHILSIYILIFNRKAFPQATRYPTPHYRKNGITPIDNDRPAFFIQCIYRNFSHLFRFHQ